MTARGLCQGDLVPRVERSATAVERPDSLSRVALGLAVGLVIAPVLVVLVLVAVDPAAFDGLGSDRDRLEQQITAVVFVQGVLMLVPLVIGIVALPRGRGGRRSVAAIVVSLAGNLLLLAVLAFPVLLALADRAG